MLREIWYALSDFVRTFGALVLFAGRLVANTPGIFVKRGGLVIKQVHNAGAMSLVIIMICGLFVGGVLGLQGYYVLVKYGSTGSLGSAVALPDVPPGYE